MEYFNLDFWKRYDDNLNIHYMNRYIVFIKHIYNKGYRQLDYKERHHIVPRSIDIDYNKKEFEIELTAREHFIAHLILEKCFNNNLKYKMEHAVTMMVFHKDMYKRDYRISSRIYEKHKLLNSRRMKQIMSTPEMKKKVSDRSIKLLKERYNGKTFYDTTGMTAHNKGKISITNGIHNKYIYKSDAIPEGWHVGNTQKKKDDKWKEHLKEAWDNSRESRIGKNHPMHGKGYLVSGKNGGTFGKKSVYKDGIVQFVDEENLPKYIEEGWTLGGLKGRKKSGKKFRYMHKDGVCKGIIVDEINDYLKDGWLFGNPITANNGVNNGSFNKVCINNGVINKRVTKDSLEQYLAEGWSTGFIKRCNNNS